MTEQALLVAVLAMIVAIYVAPWIMWLFWSIPHREPETWHTIGHVMKEQEKLDADA